MKRSPSPSATRRATSPRLWPPALSEFQSASQQVSDAEVIEAAKRGLERSVAIVHAEMKRGLSGLATIGSTAPFVGLFGTVVGIINAFKGIADQQGHRSVGGRRRYR